MNVNIIKIYIFPGRKLGHAIDRLRDFFTFRPSYLIITLTYVLMDNICPCFYNTYILHPMDSLGLLIIH